MPTWVGDVVMASPLLRAVRGLVPDAQLTAMLPRNAMPLLEPCPRVDGLLPRDGGVLAVANRLRDGQFDAAILLTNSFRSALTVRLSGIRRRIGYARDGRGWMLTDRLEPPREGRELKPVPAVDYYLAIARHLGAAAPDTTLELFTDERDDTQTMEQLVNAGWDGRRPLVVLSPGASKIEKRWPADRFGAVADRLAEQSGAFVTVTGSPAEAGVVADVIARAGVPITSLPELGIGLRQLKSVLKHADLLITNDTGPRHIAAAVGCAVVTLFGPTGPEWTLIPFDQDVHIVAGGDRQMAQIDVDHVARTAGDVLAAAGGDGGQVG
jgi:heptosyltransferase-2